MQATLSWADAPLFFGLLHEVGKRVGTAMPDRIELSPLADLGLTTHGGVLGIGAKRTLRIGLALIPMLDRQELRAALAGALAKSDPDRHAAETAGTAAAVRATEKRLLAAALVGTYWDFEVELLGTEVIPTDYVTGFSELVRRLDGGRLAKERIREGLRARTAVFDRFSVTMEEDRALAASLFGDLDRLALTLLKQSSPAGVLELPWAEIPSRVFAPALVRRARAFAHERSILQALREALDEIAAGNGTAASHGLLDLFRGALVERGGRVELGHGELLGVRFDGELAPLDVRDLDLVRAWTNRL